MTNNDAKNTIKKHAEKMRGLKNVIAKYCKENGLEIVYHEYDYESYITINDSVNGVPTETDLSDVIYDVITKRV